MMNYQQIQEDIQHDLTLIPKIKVGIIPARIVYGTTLAFIFKCSMVFLLIHTLTKFVLKPIGWYHPPITPGLIALSFIMAFITSLLLLPLLFNWVLFSQLFAGKLKTGSLFKRKYAQFCRVFLIIYGIASLLTTGFFDSGIGLDDEARRHLGSFGTHIFFVMSQAFSFLMAIVATGFISNAEMQRLGFGVLLEKLGHLLKRAPSSPHGSDQDEAC